MPCTCRNGVFAGATSARRTQRAQIFFSRPAAQLRPGSTHLQHHVARGRREGSGVISLFVATGFQNAFLFSSPSAALQSPVTARLGAALSCPCQPAFFGPASRQRSPSSWQALNQEPRNTPWHAQWPSRYDGGTDVSSDISWTADSILRARVRSRLSSIAAAVECSGPRTQRPTAFRPAHRHWWLGGYASS